MPDRWQSFAIEFKEGLITNQSPLQQGTSFPGSATLLRNFEPSIEGGYRRIKGFEKYDDEVLPNADEVRGLNYYDDEVIACRGDGVFKSSGSGWTKITDNASYSSGGLNIAGTGKVRSFRFDFGAGEKLMLLDGVGKPFTFDGTTFQQLTGLSSDTTAASHGTIFKSHVFLAVGKNLVFSSPFDETDFTPAAGGGIINLENAITGLEVFRENLFVFTENAIFQVAGSTVSDFQLTPVTRDVGCVEPDTIQEIGGDVMFLGPDGLRLLSATQRNNDFGLGVVSKNIQSEVTELITVSQSFSSLVIREKSQYRLFGYSSSYSNEAARGVIGTQFSMQGGENIAWAETRGINAYVSYSTYVGSTEYIFFANADGYVYRLENSNTFDGENIVATFNTPYLPINDPNLRKTMYKASLYVDPEGSFTSDMSVNYDFDEADVVQPDTTTLSNTTNPVSFYGVASYGIASYGGKLKFKFDTQLVGSGFVVGFQFISDSADPPFSFDTLVLEYGTYGRR